MPAPFRPRSAALDPNHYNPKVRFVRLKTPNPRRGLHCRSWGTRWLGKDYEIIHGQGWNIVPVGLADYMATVPAKHSVNPGSEGDEDEPCAFVIKKTLGEAQAYDEKESKRDAEKVAATPTLRINDLSGGMSTSKRNAPRFDELAAAGAAEEEEDDRPKKTELEDEADREVANERRRPARPRVAESEVADDDIDGQLALLEKARDELLALKRAKAERPKAEGDRSSEAKEADGGEHEEDEEEDDEAEEHEEEDEPDADNPDINTGRGDLKTVDFRAEGDKPRKPKKKQTRAERKRETEKASSKPRERSLRAAEPAKKNG